MTAPFDRITRRLNDWAGAHDHQLDARSWFVEVGNGLFQTMSEATLSDLSTSSELNAFDGGRISAPHSSRRWPATSSTRGMIGTPHS